MNKEEKIELFNKQVDDRKEHERFDTGYSDRQKGVDNSASCIDRVFNMVFDPRANELDDFTEQGIRKEVNNLLPVKLKI